MLQPVGLPRPVFSGGIRQGTMRKTQFSGSAVGIGLNAIRKDIAKAAAEDLRLHLLQTCPGIQDAEQLLKALQYTQKAVRERPFMQKLKHAFRSRTNPEKNALKQASQAIDAKLKEQGIEQIGIEAYQYHRDDPFTGPYLDYRVIVTLNAKADPLWAAQLPQEFKKQPVAIKNG